MACTSVPYICDERSARLLCRMEKAFCKLVGGSPHTVLILSYVSNSSELAAFGDAKPTFTTSDAIDALVVSARTPQNATAWGPDERVVRLIYLLTSKLVELGVTNRDRVSIDGTLYNVYETETPEGMGHETFTSLLRLTPATNVL